MQPETQQDNAGVLMRPPFLYLGVLVLAFVLDTLWSLAVLPAPGQYVLGAVLAAAGVALLAWCMRCFRRAGTNVPTPLPTTALVTEGPYARSRNPIYIALTLLYLGIASAVDLPWAALLLPVLLVVLHYGVVRREERYLAAKFGEAYAQYRARVRRWL